MRDFYNKIPELLNIGTIEKKLRKSPKEKHLETEKEKSSNELGGGVNRVFFVELATGEKGIFKPKNSEAESFSTKNRKVGSYYKRERAAYLVDRAFGFNLVPTTVIREINGEVGSFQEFIPDTVPGFESRQKTEDKEKLEKEIIKMWIFDLIIWSSDRHGNNFLAKKNKAFAIDNGFSFGDDDLATYGIYLDKPIPEEVIDKFKKFLENKDENEKDLKIALKDLLSVEEIDACIKRINKIGNLIVDNKVISEKDRHSLTFN